MSNRTYICLTCRTSRRAPAQYGLQHDYRCAQCKAPLTELPWRRRIPTKTDHKNWKTLSTLVEELHRQTAPHLTAAGLAQLQTLDRKIAHAQTPDKKRLQYQRRKLLKRYRLDGANTHP